MNTENKIAEQAEEIARLNIVLADRQATIANLMGEIARAKIAGAPAAPSELKPMYGDEPRQEWIVPAAPSEQAEPNDAQTSDAVRAYVNAGKRGKDLFEAMRAAVAAAVATAAPAAPLPAQSEPKPDFDWPNRIVEQFLFGILPKNIMWHEPLTAGLLLRILQNYDAVRADVVSGIFGAAPLPELTGPREAQSGLLLSARNLLTVFSCDGTGEPLRKIALKDLSQAIEAAKAAAASPSPAPAQPDPIIAKQVAEWRKEVARLNDLIAVAGGAPAEQQEPKIVPAFSLYTAVNALVCHIGMAGEVDSRHALVSDVMNELHKLDGGNVAKRIEDLVDLGHMPLWKATELAVDEYCATETAAPGASTEDG
jgi:hypothetical protein